MGEGRFVALTTVEAAFSWGGTRWLSSERVCLALGSRATWQSTRYRDPLA